MLRLLLKCLLILQLMYSINRNKFGADATQSELHEPMSKMEVNNVNQVILVYLHFAAWMVGQELNFL